MSTNPTPVVIEISDAISAYEAADNSRVGIIAKRSTDQTAADAAQAKADIAAAVVAADALDETSAVTNEVAALNVLKAAIDAKLATLA